MNKLEALISLNMFSAIGSQRLKKLLEFFGRPENIFKASEEKLIGVSGIGSDIAAGIRCFKNADLEKELAQIKKLNLNILTPDDKDYPENLKFIADPPIVLYVKGRLQPDDKKSIAIVGSRRASFYGLSLAEKFSRQLASHGFTIISGMARGIDTAAHKGALKQVGRTIAVIGSGFGQIYPPENKGLAEEICRQGAVISEFSVNTAPLPQNFPRRNRVISGLSLGILVVEAAQNSGALITADFALEQGREVFALPGKVDSANSSGTNGLIKQGAKLVSCVEEIEEEFDAQPNTLAVSPRKKEMPTINNNALSEEESVLYGLMNEQEPVSLDEIAEETAIGIPLLSQAIFGLQMKHLIRQLPGKQFVRT